MWPEAINELNAYRFNGGKTLNKILTKRCPICKKEISSNQRLKEDKFCNHHSDERIKRWKEETSK